ncbi:hypothetical protein IEQ34_024358 [Dendrobium chrysotoxum]|uniref:Translocon at the inner envelope membrane of chloroplasts 214 n=1 Tax=Dendrobium chrysotoxum TaxID=161865 RepID=A0AAV7FTN2_DENCH|nr:hypothetical protein IEQ34_024358 [Dendrobium chrysotoxum]
MEEGTEKEVSATTGFLAGQLMMFISIYYAPLHLALGRPHKRTVLVLPFVGWLIGHIFFMKWVGLVLFWIRQNHSIRSNKYLVSELRNSMARIFSILLFITCVYYLGRMPSPIVTKKLKEKETSETEEGGERKEESDVETTSEMKETKQEQEGSTEENPSLCSEKGGSGQNR